MNVALLDAGRAIIGPPRRLDALFDAQARATPDAPAVICRGAELSYAELAGRTAALAARLQAMGVGPGVLVALGVRRTPAMLAAMLAVLKAGAAYLPLDPAYPAERLEFMLADSGAGLLLTDCGLDERLRFAGATLDPTADRAAGEVKAADLPEGLAYVIYTSGSTGRPKGVMLGHTAAYLIEWAQTAFAAGELARVAATTSICFDPSILEIFAPLCAGGAVVLKENALEPFAADERPTMLNCVPSALIELCRAGAVPASVLAINVGGEPLKAALVREVYRRTRVEAVYNHYGPTEATTCATVAAVTRDCPAEPTLGRPIAGAQIHLLDADGRPLSPGESGEICIGGPGLALGYLNRPELTAERFVDSAWGRLYRTGDLGRQGPGGELEFLGRADGQVKIRGHRVEIPEVEAALARLPQVRQAAAVARPDPNGRLQIIAFVQSDAPLTLRDVRPQLEAWLPAHMLPARLVRLEAFPLTLSGKVDHKALPDPRPEPPAAPAAVECRIEEAVAEVFKDVLGVGQVGPEDSFFDLGGDSLAGVTAALRLGEILGHELPSAMIHQAPSPRALAEALARCPARQPEHLSVLQPGGEGRPLFCLADLFGRAFSYLSLSRRLAADRPVLGLSPGPLEDCFVADGDIPRLTRALLGEVRRIQPSGPYLIAGYSAGGVLAFDLACALERDGETAALVLLDSSMRSRAPSAASAARWALRQALDVVDPAAFRSRSARLLEMGGKLARSLAPAPAERPPAWVPPGQAALAARLMSACARYRPDAFHGPALVLKSADRDRVDALLDHDGLLGWRAALKGPVAWAWAPGDHHAFMREPHVAEAAAQIARFAARIEDD